MTLSKQKTFLLIALTLPFLVLGYLSLTNHKAQNSGTEWRVEISGYDPRDLLHGRYLRYQIEWKRHGATINSAKNTERSLCLTPTSKNSLVPKAELIDSNSATDQRSCASIIAPGNNADNWNLRLRQYYIPESFADTLDRAFRRGDHKFEISIRVSDDNKLSIGDLYIDGKTMTEAIDLLTDIYAERTPEAKKDWHFHITPLTSYYKDDQRSCYAYTIDWAAHNYTPQQGADTESLCLNETETDTDGAKTTLVSKFEGLPTQQCESTLQSGYSGRNDWNYPVRTICQFGKAAKFLDDALKNPENHFYIANTIIIQNANDNSLGYGDTLYLNAQTFNDAYKAYEAEEGNAGEAQ